MKYATKKTYGDIDRIHEIVDVPMTLPEWAPDDESFLARLFPNITGWFVVADYAANGDIVNVDGSITKPDLPPQDVRYKTLDAAEWRDFAYVVLGNLQPVDIPDDATDEEAAQLVLLAGLRRYGAILKAARASDDEGVIAALDQYDIAENFQKDRVLLFLGALEDAQIVEALETIAIASNWPLEAV